jgi:type IV pilus assembly protein PilV
VPTMNCRHSIFIVGPVLRKRSSGLSLIEMLIALLVLSFGLLGIAGLQAQSLKSNQSAYLRSHANFLAYEMMDRLRANRESALGEAYNEGDPRDPGPNDLPTSAGSDLATADRFDWRNALAELPSGLGAVSCTAERICTVGVEWDDTRGAASTAPSRILVSTEL